MYSFLISVVALLVGYLIYGGLVERIFGADDSRPTPALTKADGVDFIVLPTWKVFMVQFLNIAGTGPIFGAIMGAKFGPSAYLWIVFGCIFAGAVHDYLAGMLSLRNDGEGLPGLIGKYLGNTTKNVMLVFTVAMLIMVGAVFIYSPALILGNFFEGQILGSMYFWIVIIFIYYVITTLLPIDKIIGKIYPVFAIALIFMALSLLVCLLGKWPSIPEFWDGLRNRGPEVGMTGQSIFPCLFITVACGAISGFHATQSPLMARCLKREKLARPVFYGSMITEGLVALIWAAISSWFFFDGGASQVGLTLSAQAPQVVTAVAKSWLGVFGSILAILGVVAAPITTGDTAFRSARLTVADALHINQKPMLSRILLCVPLFALACFILWFNIADEEGFNTVWRYFGWANQTLSIFTLWALTVYLSKAGKGISYIITLVPACFMSSVCLTYIATEKIGFGLPASSIPYVACASFLVAAVLFFIWHSSRNEKMNH